MTRIYIKLLMTAILMGYLLLNEPITTSLAVGAVLVTSGVILTNAASVRLLKRQAP